MCWRARLHPPFLGFPTQILCIRSNGLLKVLFRAHQLGFLFPSAAVFFVDVVFSLLHKNPQRRVRSCAAGGQRAIEGERCTEALDKAAGQWGRQKLIREAASFTTPQLDHVCVCLCVRVCRQHIRWPWHQLKGVFVGLRVSVFISQHETSLAPSSLLPHLAPSPK